MILRVRCRSSHDGRWIATGGTAGVLTVWEYSTGRAVIKVLGHAGTINGVCFSPDDKQIVTTGEDGCISVWCVFNDDDEHG